jgi:hypothetical protein
MVSLADKYICNLLPSILYWDTVPINLLVLLEYLLFLGIKLVKHKAYKINTITNILNKYLDCNVVFNLLVDRISYTTDI